MKTFLIVASFVAVTISYATAQRKYVDIAEVKRCAMMNDARVCTNPIGITQQRERALNCSNAVYANQYANTCTRDSDNGEYCGSVYAYSRDISDAFFIRCASEIASGGVGNCSVGCRDHLMTIRDEFGCCINQVVNVTIPNSFYEISLPAFSYPLWTRCGVALPDSNCTGEIPYTLPSSPLQQEGCTSSDFAGCNNPDFLAPFYETVEADPTCQSILDYFLDVCSVDEDGAACANTDIGVEIVTVLIPLGTSCATAASTQSCSDDCKQRLQGFVDARGCCANAIYNSTYGQISGLNDSAPFLADNTLFDLCGVEPPPLSCPSASGSLPFKASFIMLLLPLVTLFGIKL